jgi:anti-sigma regulatory factor (Ser/Thr protein kinase)
LQQAIVNAQYHGNLELTSEQLEGVRESLLTTPPNDILHERRHQPPYRDRKVVVDARITRDKVEVKIADEGPGFDVSRAQASGNGVPDYFDGGRGLRLMRLLMDEVRYNEFGNEVLLIKHREPALAD